MGHGAVAVGYTVTSPAQDEDEPDLTDAWLRRLDPDGAIRWTVQYDHGLGERELASGVAVDSMGRVAVTGAVYSPQDNWDIWVALYDPGGAMVWQQLVAGDAGREDQGVGIAVSPIDDAIVVAGYQMLDDGTTDAWVRRYSVDGDVQWTVEHDGAAMGVDVATDVTVDGDGAPIIVGYETTADTASDIWVVALTDNGEERWTFLWDGPASGADRGAGVAVDEDGNVVVVGSVVAPQTTVDGWIGGLDRSGVLQWERRIDGPASLGDGANDVASFGDGTWAVGGHEFVNDAAWDAWVQRLDANGDPQWTHRHASGDGDDLVAGIGIDAAGDVLALGSIAVPGGPRAIWLRKIAG